MEKESTFAADVAESEEAWRQQFDPKSETFHGGLKDSVPLGGERVPESMPDTYPENYNPNDVPVEIDYGQEYKDIEAGRKAMQNLKKSISKLPPVLEAFLRHEEAFKSKGDPNNEKHIKTHEEHMKKQRENLVAVQEELQKYVPVVESAGSDGKLAAVELKTIIVESNKKYENKETLTDFNFRINNFSAKCFANTGKLLQKMKDIKKVYAKKAKEEAKKEEPKQAEEPKKEEIAKE